MQLGQTELFLDSSMKIRAYADDILLWVSGQNVVESIAILQQALNAVHNLLEGMGMKLSPHKCVSMILSHRQPRQGVCSLNLKIGDSVIPMESHMKYLGLQIDSSLS